MQDDLRIRTQLLKLTIRKFSTLSCLNFIHRLVNFRLVQSSKIAFEIDKLKCTSASRLTSAISLIDFLHQDYPREE